MSEYLVFSEEQVPGRKTSIFNVYSKNHGDLLATIKWFGRWRQFCFFPEPGSVWNAQCLIDVQRFIHARMEERR